MQKRASLEAGQEGQQQQQPRQAAAQAPRVSWDGDLDTYVHAQSGAASTPQRTLRAKLVEAVKKDPASPEAWWALLQQEESASSSGTATLTQGGGVRGGVGLFDLYHWATKLVPRQANYHNEAYVKIWLGYARQQWYKNKDDARDTFKTLRSQHIGDRSASLYYEWASLEQMAGHASRATSVLQKGLREQAQPAGLLEQMQQDVQEGKFVYCPPWAMSTGSLASLTGHSNGSYAAFLTPGGLDQRRQAATPTLGASQVKASTETLVLGQSRPAGASSQASQQQQQLPAPAAGARGGSPSEQDTVIINHHQQQQQQQMRAPGGSQHTGGLAEQYANRTSHTFTSSSTGTASLGSEGPTATVRMPTPTGGMSHHSNSTTGSIGEEATVSLRKPGSGSGGGVPAAVRPSRLGESAGGSRRSQEDTVIVNRAVLRPAGTNAAQEGAAKDQALPPKPRRTGMLGLGRALRVTPGSAPAVPAAEAAPAAAVPAVSAEDAEAANRKRKAEAEAAHSPKPPVAGGDFKRRSPVNEARSSHVSKPQPEPAAVPPRPRQLPPIPRFDGSMPPAAPSSAAQAAAATASSDGAAAASSRAAPAAAPTPRPSVAATAAAPPRQQVVLEEHSKAGGGGGGSDDETVPHVMSKLALKIAKGRQSLAPGKVVMKADGAVVGPNETSSSLDSQEDDDAPTQPVARLPPADATSMAAKGDEDPDATRPLSRPTTGGRASPPRPAVPPRQVHIDGAGNVKLQQAQGPRPVPAPAQKRMPLPPPAMLPDDESKLALGAPAAPPGRVPMGPPAPMPPKHLRVQQQGGELPGMQQEVAAAAVGQPRRRVIEDENTIVVKGIAYTKLECVGRGGSSKVYKVMAPNRKIFALKRIRLSGRDSEAASGFLDEITLLNKLKGRSNIIQLIDSEVHRHEGLIYMVLECGDIDLARLLQKHEKARQEHVNADDVDENFIRLYWEQMLQAVYSIHEERIVHSDLKPANFLMVEGQLKLIDFGIAKAIQADTTSIARESQVGTLNYMSPEAILGGQNNIRGGPPMKVGRPSDVWSLGCILYQMVYGHTPFSHLPFIQKMHAIIDPNHRIAFLPIHNRALMDVMQRCLDRNPRSRITMRELLEHPFLRPTQLPVARSSSDAGAGAGEVRLSKEQLTKLLLQASQAGVSNSNVGQLSEELFRQISSGLSPNVLASKAAAAANAQQQPAEQDAAAVAAAVPPPPTAAAGPGTGGAGRSRHGPPPQQQQQQPGAPRPRAEPASVAEAATRAAAARADQRAAAVAAVDSRPRVVASGNGRAPLAPISQSAILQQAAALRKVEPPGPVRPQEGGLEAALRKGLERFKFDDTLGTTAHDDTTGDFSAH